MKACPRCNTKCLNSAVNCECGYSFHDDPPEPSGNVSVHREVAPPVNPAYLEITWDRVLVLWWGLVWRGTIFGVAVGAVLGFCGGFLVGFAGHPELGAAVGMLLGWLGSIPLSIVILRIVLWKKFSEFSVRLVRNP